MTATKGFLVLETGEIFEGRWHGGRERAGEVVFNTSHAGYEEIATDPSYYKQIMIMTAPMMGNYGSITDDSESKQIWIDGFICLQIEEWGVGASWRNRLLKNQVPILSEIDTRKLVLRLRDYGTPWGALVSAGDEEAAKIKAVDLIRLEKSKFTVEVKDWTAPVAGKSPLLVAGGNPKGPRIAVLDFGIKSSIVKNMAAPAKELMVFPGSGKAQLVKDWNPDGVLLSNGPGDPSDVRDGTQAIKDLLGWKPIFGICMGHQTLALALGASTYKLKFGHRGGNHPVKDDLLKTIYITSQNHGYAVKDETLPRDARVTHTNLYDGTIEGIECERLKCVSVQFHPESAPGPHDAAPLFQYFVKRWL